MDSRDTRRQSLPIRYQIKPWNRAGMFAIATAVAAVTCWYGVKLAMYWSASGAGGLAWLMVAVLAALPGYLAYGLWQVASTELEISIDAIQLRQTFSCQRMARAEITGAWLPLTKDGLEGDVLLQAGKRLLVVSAMFPLDERFYTWMRQTPGLVTPPDQAIGH